MNSLLTGWKDIAAFLGRSRRWAIEQKESMLECRVIFYRPMKRGKRTVNAWTADLQTWSKKVV